MKSKEVKISSPVALFIGYLYERGYKRVNSTTFVNEESGDKVVIEYVRGKSAMLHCHDGNAYVIWYHECPVPKKTLTWWEKEKSRGRKRIKSKRHTPRRRKVGPVVVKKPSTMTAMERAMREAEK